MIRFLCRLLGLMCLASAFVLLIYDGMRSMASNTVALTSTSELWDMVQATGTQGFQRLVDHYLPGVWESVLVPLLSAPSWAVLGVLGILLLLLGRRKKPLIGYAR